MLVILHVCTYLECFGSSLLFFEKMAAILILLVLVNWVSRSSLGISIILIPVVILYVHRYFPSCLATKLNDFVHVSNKLEPGGTEVELASALMVIMQQMF